MIAYFDCLIFIFPNLFWPPYHSTPGPYLFILDGYSAANLQHTFCTFIVTCSICCGNGHIMLQFFFHNKKNYMIKQSICLICAMEQKVSCIQWKDLWNNCIERKAGCIQWKDLWINCIERKASCKQWKDLWFVSRGKRVVYNGEVCDLYRGKRVVYNGKVCDLYREESEMYAMERSVNCIERKVKCMQFKDLICIERKVKCMQWKDLWFVSRGKRDVCNGKICDLYPE